MLEDVIAAFERQDYKTAAWLLKQLETREPQNLWVQFYIGRLHEVTNKLERAESIYRRLLQETANAKIMAQARQGLKRLQDLAAESRRQALAAAAADPSSAQEGALVLQGISNELKAAAAPKLAKILQTDAYTARLQIPSQGWRLFRTGALGQLRFYGEQMQQAGIPCFWAAIADIQSINVFAIRHFTAVAPQPAVICQNASGLLGSLTFNWSEVTRRVEGMLPIFEEVFDTDARRQVQHKTQVLDYARVCDLHLPGRKSILRLSDRHYQFDQGIAIAAASEQVKVKRSSKLVSVPTTTREKWNDLQDFLQQYLPQQPVLSEFNSFAETGLDQVEMLWQLKSHIDLSPQEETAWDKAFQLYSGLAFIKGS